MTAQAEMDALATLANRKAIGGRPFTFRSSGGWRAELERLRTEIYSYLNNYATFTRFTEENGEIFGGDGLHMAIGALSSHKYGITSGGLSPTGQISGGIYDQYQNIELVWAGPGDVQISCAGTARVYEYLLSDVNFDQRGPSFEGYGPRNDVEFRIRFETPFALTIAPTDNVFEPAPHGTPLSALPLRLTATGGAQVAFVEANRRIFLRIGGTVPKGVTEWVIHARVDDPYKWVDIKSLDFSFTGVAQFAARRTAAIHNTLDTWAKSVDGDGISKIRISSLTRRKYRTPGGAYVAPPIEFTQAGLWNLFPTRDWRYFGNAYTLTQTPAAGYWLAQVVMVGGLNCVERITEHGSGFNRPVLAYYAADIIANDDGSVRVGGIDTLNQSGQQAVPAANALIVPRCFFCKTTDIPNQVSLGQISPGSTIHEVYVRRQATGEPGVQTATTELAVEIGCMRNGVFVPFEVVTLTPDEPAKRIFPDWMVFTPHSLAYRADERVDIQAMVMMPNPVPFGSSAGPFSRMKGSMADFYNNAEAMLNVIADGN